MFILNFIEYTYVVHGFGSNIKYICNGTSQQVDRQWQYETKQKFIAEHELRMKLEEVKLLKERVDQYMSEQSQHSSHSTAQSGRDDST